MTQEITPSQKIPKFCSVIQVDKDVSFVINNGDLNNIPLPVPSDKSIGMSRKTYSKKNPIVYNSIISCSDDNVLDDNKTPRIRKSILKNSPKCSSDSKVSKQMRKRPLDTPKSTVAKRLKRKEPSSTKVPLCKVNGRFSNKVQKSLLDSRPDSPDSDIEILEVFEGNSSRILKNLGSSFSGRERSRLSDVHRRRNSKPMLTILKPCYPSNDDVPITEADIAPVIPSNSVIPDTSVSESNQDLKVRPPNKWLFPNGTPRIAPLQNGEICSAKELTMKHVDKSNLIEPERKTSRNVGGRELKNLYNNLNEVYWAKDKNFQQTIKTSRNVGGRELKNLYKNLNEIYWAKEKNFQQMIQGNTDNRHSERITAKAVDAGKSLRRLQAGSRNLKPVSSAKQKKSLANKNSARFVLNRAKYGRLKPKLVLSKGSKFKTSRENIKRSQTKPIVQDNRNLNAGMKNTQQKIGSKMKPVADIKQKPQLSSSRNNPKTANNALKIKPSNINLPSAGKSCLSSALKKSIVKSEKTGDVVPKSSSDSNVVNKFQKIEFANEVEIFNKSFNENKIFTTAVKKGSKLRVRVEPLEHTNLWNSDFCEAFSKFVLEQSSSQMGAKNQDSIKAMFEELMESWFHPPNDSKFPKKKKPEEETLRSSVRQSEGAFRYKEIVVKKHENYMQFILVPNAVKQNSLTIEAMKELREAFLLAKKDPNIRAVLLNSSGPFFCSGIDLSLLIGNNKKQVAEEMALTIKELILTLSTFTKPVVAAVNGTAVGFGVSLLTFCDVVLASDKATFCIPATRLGYMPEGAITLTLPQVVGSTVATELLLYGRRLTADQALRYGLVSEVLWHSNLMNEVVPRVQIIVSQPLQVMEATKSMVRCQLWDKLKFHIEREWRLLPSLWLDAQCQNNIKRALQTGWLID